EVEAMPVERPWGELLYHADGELTPIVAVAANIESLHRMTREERELKGLIVAGSDHLTAYNVFAEAVNKHGYLGEVYGLPRHLFRESVDSWAEGRGVLVKAIEDVALGTASVYRQLELSLPEKLPYAGEKTVSAFADLVARVMPFDLVIDEETADGREVRVSRGSMCGTRGPRGLGPGGAVRSPARGHTPHPDQTRVRRALERFGFYWRRSGGRLAEAATEQIAARLGRQLDSVASWQNFIETRITLDVDETIPVATRQALEALPSSAHLYGDRGTVEYEVDNGVGVVRLRLKEGQARRLQVRDLPAFDRPVRFTVVRGKREALRSDTLDG